MDEGPFRVSRPAARRATSQSTSPARAESAQSRPVQESIPQPTAVPSEPPKSSAPPKKKASLKEGKNPRRRLVLIAIIISLAVAVPVVAALFNGSDNGIDKNKYQAVFLTNGDHYFGKLGDVNDGYMRLTDIYYLQRTSTEDGDSSPDNIQQSAGTQNKVELKKLGDEIHGPEDEMIISRDNILYYENIKPEGQAARAIEEHKKTSN